MYIGEEEVWSEDGEFEHHSPIDTSITVGRFQVGTRATLSSQSQLPRKRSRDGVEKAGMNGSAS